MTERMTDERLAEIRELEQSGNEDTFYEKAMVSELLAELDATRAENERLKGEVERLKRYGRTDD